MKITSIINLKKTSSQIEALFIFRYNSGLVNRYHIIVNLKMIEIVLKQDSKDLILR